MVEWCAEIGSNHQGSKALAYELIRKAKWAGATIAKFQLGWDKKAQKTYCDSYNKVRDIDDWVEDLDGMCTAMGIEFMASIWSQRGLDAARSVGMKRYKVAHQMRDNKLMKAIRDDGKEVFFSSTHGEPLKIYPILWLPIYCTDDYPTLEYSYPAEGVSKYRWEGYSSHMFGISDALMAVTNGANFIEKHLVLHRYAGFPKDAAFSLEPDEFKQMTEIGNEIARLR